MNIAAIVAQLELQTSWFLNALQGLSEEESNIPFDENVNPIKWVAGHLTDSRLTVFSLLSGQPIHPEYKKNFGKGTPNKLSDNFPSLEQIKDDWRAASSQLITMLQSLPEEFLLSKPPFQTSIPDETLLGLVAFFTIHESFHIGQISVSRKLIGKQPMSMGRATNPIK